MEELAAWRVEALIGVRAEDLSGEGSRERSFAGGENLGRGERAGGERIHSRCAWSRFAGRLSLRMPSKNSSAVLNGVIGMPMRKKLGDTEDDSQMIRTESAVGYRFLAGQ